MRYRFARALATRINAPTSANPHHFPPVINRVQTSALMTETRTLVLIPARMAATRLPGKPLLDIAGLPMIVHVLRRAEAAANRPRGGRHRHAGDRGGRQSPWL